MWMFGGFVVDRPSVCSGMRARFDGHSSGGSEGAAAKYHWLPKLNIS